MFIVLEMLLSILAQLGVNADIVDGLRKTTGMSVARFIYMMNNGKLPIAPATANKAIAQLISTYKAPPRLHCTKIDFASLVEHKGSALVTVEPMQQSMWADELGSICEEPSGIQFEGNDLTNLIEVKAGFEDDPIKTRGFHNLVDISKDKVTSKVKDGYVIVGYTNSGVKEKVFYMGSPAMKKVINDKVRFGLKISALTDLGVSFKRLMVNGARGSSYSQKAVKFGMSEDALQHVLFVEDIVYTERFEANVMDKDGNMRIEEHEEHYKATDGKVIFVDDVCPAACKHFKGLGTYTKILEDKIVGHWTNCLTGKKVTKSDLKGVKIIAFRSTMKYGLPKKGMTPEQLKEAIVQNPDYATRGYFASQKEFNQAAKTLDLKPYFGLTYDHEPSTRDAHFQVVQWLLGANDADIEMMAQMCKKEFDYLSTVEGATTVLPKPIADFVRRFPGAICVPEIFSMIKENVEKKILTWYSGRIPRTVKHIPVTTDAYGIIGKGKCYDWTKPEGVKVYYYRNPMNKADGFAIFINTWHGENGEDLTEIYGKYDLVVLSMYNAKEAVGMNMDVDGDKLSRLIDELGKIVEKTLAILPGRPSILKDDDEVKGYKYDYRLLQEEVNKLEKPALLTIGTSANNITKGLAHSTVDEIVEHDLDYAEQQIISDNGINASKHETVDNGKDASKSDFRKMKLPMARHFDPKKNISTEDCEETDGVLDRYSRRVRELVPTEYKPDWYKPMNNYELTNLVTASRDDWSTIAGLNKWCNRGTKQMNYKDSGLLRQWAFDSKTMVETIYGLTDATTEGRRLLAADSMTGWLAKNHATIEDGIFRFFMSVCDEDMSEHGNFFVMQYMLEVFNEYIVDHFECKVFVPEDREDDGYLDESADD